MSFFTNDPPLNCLHSPPITCTICYIGHTEFMAICSYARKVDPTPYFPSPSSVNPRYKNNPGLLLVWPGWPFCTTGVECDYYRLCIWKHISSFIFNCQERLHERQLIQCLTLITIKANLTTLIVLQNYVRVLKDSTFEKPYCISDSGMAVKPKQQVGEKGGSKMDGKENNYCSAALWILER